MVRNYKSYEPKDVKKNAHPEKSLYQKHNNQQGCYLYLCYLKFTITLEVK